MDGGIMSGVDVRSGVDAGAGVSVGVGVDSEVAGACVGLQLRRDKIAIDSKAEISMTDFLI